MMILYKSVDREKKWLTNVKRDVII